MKIRFNVTIPSGSTYFKTYEEAKKYYTKMCSGDWANSVKGWRITLTEERIIEKNSFTIKNTKPGSYW